MRVDEFAGLQGQVKKEELGDRDLAESHRVEVKSYATHFFGVY